MTSRFSIHLRTFLFLFPFSIMLLLQQILGIDDNLMVAPRPGMRDGALFNLIMALVFWIGLVGFFVHTIIHANESKVWLALKITTLVGIFVAITYFSPTVVD